QVERRDARATRALRERLAHPVAQLGEDLRRDLLGREILWADLDGRLLPHLAFDRLDGRVRAATPRARRVADEEGARLLVPRDRRGHRAPPEAVGEDDEVALFGREPR